MRPHKRLYIPVAACASGRGTRAISATQKATLLFPDDLQLARQGSARVEVAVERAVRRGYRKGGLSQRALGVAARNQSVAGKSRLGSSLRRGAALAHEWCDAREAPSHR